MKKKTSLRIGIVLLIAAVCWIAYAVGHPETAFPWGQRVTYLLYGIYLWLLFKFLLDLPVLKAVETAPANGNVIRAIVFFFMAIVFLMTELSRETASVYTVFRGFVVMGGVDRGTGNLALWIKQRKQTTGA